MSGADRPGGAAGALARALAWLLDTAALAYAAWALHVLASEVGRGIAEEGLAPLPPWLARAIPIGAPLAAWLWGALAPTLGERALGIALAGPTGSRASPAERLARAFSPPGGVARARTRWVRERELRRPRGSRPPRWFRDPVALPALALALQSFAVGWTVAEVRLLELVDARNLQKLGEFAAGFLHPDWRVLGAAVEKMVETLFLALMATLFAVPVAAVLAFLAARNVMPSTFAGNAVYLASRTFFTFVRSTEPIVWAVVFCAWVGIGPFAGTLALFVHSVASLVKLYSEAIEQVDPGPTEALRAVGAGPVATLWRAVVPEVVPAFVAFTMYRWDINVRMATILGMVGAGGIGLMLMQNSNLLRWGAVAVIILCITAVVLALDLASAWIRRRIR